MNAGAGAAAAGGGQCAGWQQRCAHGGRTHHALHTGYSTRASPVYTYTNANIISSNPALSNINQFPLKINTCYISNSDILFLF